MYEHFYGLHERPFDLTPDPRYLFLTPKHQEALANLHYGIAQRKGVTAVLGPAGTGKTTLVRAARAAVAEAGGRCVSVTNPSLKRDEFIQMIARGFELSADAAESKATMLAELEVRLREYRAAGTVTALVIDEAQALSDELLEEVRLLVNFETDTDKLLPVVLAGQDELSERLAQPSNAALKQRIALRCHLLPLTARETAQYIASRLRIAGGVPGDAFTRDAIDVIHQRSGGIPRTISVICDNSLMSGFAVDQRPVGRQLVLEVCRDFDFETALAPAGPHGVPRPASAPAVPPVMTKPPAAPTPHMTTSTSTATTTATTDVNGAPARRQAEDGPPEKDARLFATFGRPVRSWFSGGRKP
jgi:general secretion pathway protein A